VVLGINGRVCGTLEANYLPPRRAVGGGLQLSAAEGESESDHHKKGRKLNGKESKSSMR
jgi:hypothetical protein